MTTHRSARARSRRGRVTSLLLAVVTACGLAVASQAPANALTAVSGVHLTSIDARLLADINGARAAAGVPALRVMASLTDSAVAWSTTQAAQNRISHSPSWTTRIARSGCTTWTAIAENVGTYRAAPTDSVNRAADVLFSLYRGSSVHWHNITSRSFSQVGVATVDRIVTDPNTGRQTSKLYNTLEFAAGCRPTPQRVQTWGVYQERVGVARGTVRSVDTFESKDMRAAAANWSPSIAASIAWPRPTAGDDALLVRLANTSMAATGADGLSLRQGIDLTAARTLRLKIRVADGAHRALPMTVLARQQWGAGRRGTDCILGRITVPTATSIVSVPVPAGCRFYSNVFSFRVSAAALATLGRTLPSRAATFHIYDLSAEGQPLG